MNEEILARLSKVEAENRQLRFAALLAFIAALSCIVFTFSHRSVIETQRLILRDEGGRARAELAMDNVGRPSLHFRDSDGKPVVALEDSREGVTLSLNHTESKSSISFQARGDISWMAISHRGNSSVSLAAFMDTSVASLCDAKHHDRIQLQSDGGASNRRMADTEGRQVSTWGTHQTVGGDEKATLNFLNKNQRVTTIQ